MVVPIVVMHFRPIHIAVNSCSHSDPVFDFSHRSEPSDVPLLLVMYLDKASVLQLVQWFKHHN